MIIPEEQQNRLRNFPDGLIPPRVFWMALPCSIQHDPTENITLIYPTVRRDDCSHFALWFWSYMLHHLVWPYPVVPALDWHFSSGDFQGFFLVLVHPLETKTVFFFLFYQIRFMGINNGTPEKKGNASLPPGRGKIVAKSGEESKTFITRTLAMLAS